MARSNKKKIFSKKLLLVLAVTLLVFSGLAFNSLRNKSGTSTTELTETENIDLSPATDEEKQQVEENKKRLSEEIDNEQQNPGALKQVKPVITSAEQFENNIEVRTLVTGVYESGGYCVATFTLGGQKIERKVEGIQDATTTRCDVVVVPITEFSPGSWDLVVAYTSATSSGASDISKVEIK